MEAREYEYFIKKKRERERETKYEGPFFGIND